GEIERLRQHADYRPTHIVDSECSSHNTSICLKPILPELVGQQDRPWPMSFALFSDEVSAQQWSYSKSLQKTTGDNRSFQPCRFPLFRQSITNSLSKADVGPEFFKGFIGSTPVDEIGAPGETWKSFTGLGIGDPNQAFGGAKGQRPQQNGI